MYYVVRVNYGEFSTDVTVEHNQFTDYVELIKCNYEIHTHFNESDTSFITTYYYLYNGNYYYFGSEVILKSEC